MNKHMKKIMFCLVIMAVVFSSCSKEVTPKKVTEVAVTDVALSQRVAVLNVGQTLTLTETILPDSATNKAVSWGSNDTNVATVANGLVTAISSGTVTVTVTTQDGSKQAICYVIVNGENTPKQMTMTMEVELVSPFVEMQIAGSGTITIVGVRDRNKNVYAYQLCWLGRFRPA